MFTLAPLLLSLVLSPGGNTALTRRRVHARDANADSFRKHFGWPGHKFSVDRWGVVVLNPHVIEETEGSTTVAVGNAGALPSSTVSLSLAGTPPTDSSIIDAAPTESSALTVSSAINFSILPSSSATRSALSTESASSSSSSPEKTSTPATRSQTHALTPSPSPKPPSQSPTNPAPANVEASPSSQGDASGGPTSQSDIQEYLSTHNSVRAQHGATPLTYSQSLAAKAQQWANGCVFKHSGGSLGAFGENLAAGTGDGYGIPQAVQSWTDEVSQYDPNNPQPSHFTQVVWKSTTEVGCALQNCAGIFPSNFGLAHFYVCEYSPQGNVIGEFAQNVQV